MVSVKSVSISFPSELAICSERDLSCLRLILDLYQEIGICRGEIGCCKSGTLVPEQREYPLALASGGVEGTVMPVVTGLTGAFAFGSDEIETGLFECVANREIFPESVFRRLEWF